MKEKLIWMAKDQAYGILSLGYVQVFGNDYVIFQVGYVTGR